jgi:hypothetical protein
MCPSIYYMNFLKIIRRLLPKESPKPVGRWNIDNCNKKTDAKIDLSNEDHCGPCGQYALTKQGSITNGAEKPTVSPPCK